MITVHCRRAALTRLQPPCRQREPCHDPVWGKAGRGPASSPPSSQYQSASHSHTGLLTHPLVMRSLFLDTLGILNIPTVESTWLLWTRFGARSDRLLPPSPWALLGWRRLSQQTSRNLEMMVRETCCQSRDVRSYPTRWFLTRLVPRSRRGFVRDKSD